ncbi:uncharacterized protein TM35_000011130 [Trypanosoma theileri]|uniref:PrimPol-like protein 2 n=1 Tax=Trypanosoma theileri TaxID=67003 RepID=A0A1X0P8G3_9TRYP|nr:uncharacterized protein TM35_000011130 [Trypanosoma theileri]ORC93236.1 hypothetical protein TM35_000011130 [Trypanosoma theileri]
MEKSSKVPRFEANGASVNAIFAVTGPTAGILHIRSALELPQDHTVNDDALRVLDECFDSVAVPADQYWRAASQHRALMQSTDNDDADTTVHPHSTRLPFTLDAAVNIRRPDPMDIPRSFYSTRLDAIVQRRYAVNQGELVVASDNRSGSSGKMFNTIPRDELVSFIETIPFCHQRNLYVMVDENSAVDPFFDIDCCPPFDWMEYDNNNESDIIEEEEVEKGIEKIKKEKEDNITSPSLSSSFQVTTATVERWLREVLYFLRDKVESATGAQLQQCLVLTSSVILRDDKTERKAGDVGRESESLLSTKDTKISFHIHFRLNTNTAFANIRELHRFMSHIREELDLSLSQGKESHNYSLNLMLRRCIDFGVYTRWRAFRLPYNVKLPSPLMFSAVDASALDLMVLELSQLHIKVVTPLDNRVGKVAPTVAHFIDISSLQKKSSSSLWEHHYRMLTKLFFLYRFLLPIVPGMTSITDKKLIDFLSAYLPSSSHNGDSEKDFHQELAHTVFDLASIQRDNCTTEKNEERDVTALRLFRMTSLINQNTSTAVMVENQNPFALPRPPLRDGVRVSIRDIQVKDLVAEVFRCLSIEYDGGVHRDRDQQGNMMSPLSGNCVNVQYQECIRAYYAQQKQSRFCLNQNREHRGTYPQLYLTYGSIKLRCYSNDCCKSCLAIKWSTDDDERVTGTTAVLLPVDSHGYPKYERLSQIRRLLFPPLSPEELLKRYGASALEGMQQPQKTEQIRAE